MTSDDTVINKGNVLRALKSKQKRVRQWSDEAPQADDGGRKVGVQVQPESQAEVGARCN